jgi:predicted RNase H-like HicB family nuclease
MQYAYPVVLTPEDGKILVRVPDLKTVYSFGANIPDALLMAKDAIEMFLWHTENEHGDIPPASSIPDVEKLRETDEEFISLVAADTDEYRKQFDTRSVKKTLTIPGWLNYKAELANAPFSQILQQGLKQYLNIKDAS